ncbi:MAG: DUF1512 domain-containing protein [Candidatus Hecatellales archaeon]|nr:MAG: DUF1512 domain-containing protein [Candidatus Hecatellales archaeon]
MPFLQHLAGEGGNLWSLVFQLFFIAFIIAYFLYGQRIQIAIWNRDIERNLRRLKFLRDRARETAIKAVKEIGKPEEDPVPSIDRFLETFFIQPVDMDPAGIVWKLDRLLDVRDLSMKDAVRRIAPKASDTELNNLENLLEAALDLNLIYRIVRHYYLMGKRTNAYIITAQLHMMLPLIMDIAYAYDGAVKAFAEGQPIGDGAGPLLACKLLAGKKVEKIEKDMVFGETELEGRHVIVLKAEGPGGNVGKPGEAIEKLIDTYGYRPAIIVMVDAAQKFEGEDTGDVADGVGAAIGGIGTEKYRIEEVAHKHKIPLYAVIIKESLREAIAPMKKEIYEGVDKAIETVKKIIREKTREGDLVLIAGIGNTIGIAQ